jgi:hypothetical protein
MTNYKDHLVMALCLAVGSCLIVVVLKAALGL